MNSDSPIPDAVILCLDLYLLIVVASNRIRKLTSEFEMKESPFTLHELPLDRRYGAPWDSFVALGSSAIVNLGRLNGMLKVFPKAGLLQRAWLVREAKSSNEIEGVFATIEEIEECRLGFAIPVRRKLDIQCVLRYQEAVQHGLNELRNGRFFSISLLKSVRTLLLQDAHGESKASGVWRTDPIITKKSEASLDQDSFLLPDSIFVEKLMENWEDFARREDLNPIIQAAVLHAQFMMIQPFSEDNGRMGRLLVTLFLASKNILSNPCFFVSSYLLRHHEAYYASLAKITKNKDWNPWISFFLNAVSEESKANAASLLRQVNFYKTKKNNFSEKTVHRT